MKTTKKPKKYVYLTDPKEIVKEGDQYINKIFIGTRSEEKLWFRLGCGGTILEVCGNKDCFSKHSFRRAVYKKKIG